MRNLIKRFIQDQSGVSAIEYGLISALLVIVMVVGIASLGPKLEGVFASASSARPVD